MFNCSTIKYPLNSRLRATSFITLVAICGLALIGDVTRVAIADSWGASGNIANVNRAASLDHLNPEFQRRLGLFYEYDWRQLDFDKALFHFKQATKLQPDRADYWVDEARACAAVKDDKCADLAYERATSLAPAIPKYQWEIANYYLVSGRQNEALSHFRRFLELDPEDPSSTFSACLRAWSDPELIWRTLPAKTDSRLKSAYISFLNERGRPEDAYRFWDTLVASNSAMSFMEVQPYLDKLIATNHVDRASQVWRDIERLGVIQSSSTGDPANQVFNGGFEHDPLNSGFDWRTVPQEYVTLDFAENDCYNSKRCLRVDFPVPNNAEYEPIYQIVPIEPNRQYELIAYVRSAEISSDSGPRLRVIDPECPTCVSAESQASIGTTPWHKISVNFSTGPKTQAIHVSVWRPRGRSFPMEIQGTFWLDSVSLKAAPATPAS